MQDELTAEQIRNVVKDIDAIKLDIKDLVEKQNKCNTICTKTFVLLQRYLPVEKIVYGLVATVLLTVIGAILAMILTQGKAVHP
jgi:hypothetical protein